MAESNTNAEIVAPSAADRVVDSAAVSQASNARPSERVRLRAGWLVQWLAAASLASALLGAVFVFVGARGSGAESLAAAGGLAVIASFALWVAFRRRSRRQAALPPGLLRVYALVLALAGLACWWLLTGQDFVPAGAGGLVPVSSLGIACWLLPFVHWMPGGGVYLAAVVVAGWLSLPPPPPDGVHLVLPTIMAAAALAGLAIGTVVSRFTAGLAVGASKALAESASLRRDLDASQKRTTHEAEQRREVEKELALAREAADEAVRAKTEFLATMSHEIRTPLNGILPILDLMQGTALNDEQREYLDTAYKSSRHLLRLINDILDYAKVEAGKLELESIELNVQDLVESVTDLMGRAAESKGLQVIVRVEDTVPDAVRGDPIRVRQILTNLVSNAIKFTNQGSIQIEVKRQRVDRKFVELLFAVTDTGIGMSQDAARRLFQSFSQADASTTRKHGGTGLGLVICKRLVELMGGRIGVRTSLNRGSTFWFLLPMRRSLHDVPSVRRDLHGVRALTLVQDPVERDRIGRMLQSLGILEDRANSALAALGKLKNSAGLGDSWLFDLVLMDARGYENGVAALVREVQAEQAFGSMPIVIVASPDSRLQGLRRFAEVSLLPPPLQQEKLKYELHRLLDVGDSAWRGSSGVDAAEKAAWEPALMASEVAFGATLPEARVLLVEDNPINLAVARRLLERVGMIVTVAEDGHECLLRIEREGPFDLVLMDVQMPVMDGYEATGRIREMEAAGSIRKVPVVAMTANAMQGDRERCLEAGMDDYLPKPIDLSTLRTTLGRWLGGRKDAAETMVEPAAPARAEAAAEAPPQEPKPEDPAPSATPTEDREAGAAVPAGDDAVLDAVILDDLREIMEDEFARLIRQYLDNAPKQLETLEEAARQGDVAALVRPAHSLKSSSANVGAMRLSALAREVEHDARSNRGTTAVAALPSLREALAETARELEAYIERNA